MPTCIHVNYFESEGFKGKQGKGFFYYEGISAQSAGSLKLCMHRLVLPAGARGVAHLHKDHENAIYVIEGRVDTWFGDKLESFVVVGPGDYLYIPANVPHLPWNKQETPAVAIVSRTDANEQESVVLLPELDAAFMALHA